MAQVPGEIIEGFAGEFDDLCNARMQFGEEKYGQFTWLEAPTIDMALEELADFANYARMTAVKLRLIQMQITQSLEQAGGFVPTNPEKE